MTAATRAVDDWCEQVDTLLEHYDPHYFDTYSRTLADGRRVRTVQASDRTK